MIRVIIVEEDTDRVLIDKVVEPRPPSQLKYWDSDMAADDVLRRIKLNYKVKEQE